MLSAILDNVTTVIFTYPMALGMARRLRINGSAFLLPMVMAANIGGTATLIGDPPNVLIGADRAHRPLLHGLHLQPHGALHVHDDRAGLVQPALLPRRHRRGADADHAGAAAPTGAALQNVPLLRATLLDLGADLRWAS